MIQQAAEALWRAESDALFEDAPLIVRQWTLIQASEAAGAIADWLEGRYGSLHPGCLAIRAEIDRFSAENAPTKKPSRRR